MIIEILVFTITALFSYVWFVYKRIHWKFDKYGVKYLPGHPLFGNAMQSFLMKRHFCDVLKELYAAFPNERYYGYIEGMTPVIMIRDPELIKNVTLRDFDHFVDHKDLMPADVDPLFGGSVFMMKGDRWRDMRATLSPAFTGSKMRSMIPFMTDCSHNVVKYLREHQHEDVDVTDLIDRYTTDVIASAGFGLQIDSVNDTHNLFFNTVQKLFKAGVWEKTKFVMSMLCPEILKALNLNVFSKETMDFFTNLVTFTIDFREKNNVYRPDMIQLIMDASKGKVSHSQIEETDDIGFATVEEHLKSHENVKDWTQAELISQIFLFFSARFENASSAVIFAIHELTINPEVQEKAYQEIKAFQKTEGSLTYDNIRMLKYLDGVFNETMRKWSLVTLDRQCTKPYELPPPHEDGQPYQIQNGEIIHSAAIPVHWDPQIYPEPEKFKPERFDDKNNIQPFTFMPFGLGPRNCIGSRFAILQCKVVLYSLLSNFKFTRCARTSEPLVRAPAHFNGGAVGGTWVMVEARD